MQRHEPGQERERDCLRCGTRFVSQHFGNRICPTCHKYIPVDERQTRSEIHGDAMSRLMNPQRRRFSSDSDKGRAD